MYAIALIMKPVSGKELILTYSIREGQKCLPGMLFYARVRGRREEAVILRLTRAIRGDYTVRELEEAVFPEPVISRRSLALARWLARYYICPLNKALALFIPPAARSARERRYYAVAEAFGDGKQAGALFIDPALQPLADGLIKSAGRGLTEKTIERRWGKEALEHIDSWVRAGYARAEAGLRLGRKRPRKNAIRDIMSTSRQLKLSPEQELAYDKISDDMLKGKYARHLLFGVTGSGKTEVYLRLADLAASRAAQTICLVPEISLVPQLLAKASEWFGQSVAILHSNLTPSQRYAEWQRIREGDVKLIIGPRSALFAPVANLGLIIIDEEHEHTYKQGEPDPRYDARKTAEVLARLWKAVVLRGSATPDLESLYRVEKGEIALSSLPGRFARRPMPPIEWINMNREMKEGHTKPVSRRLLAALNDRKQKGEQAIFLLNRRGYHTYVLCRDCGKPLECPRCSISLTYHRDSAAGAKLICHYCDYRSPVWRSCPYCGGATLQYMGSGTQRVTDCLTKEIPDLRILRLDMDATVKAGSHNEILKAFQEGKADVLVGTQMVAKGFDFPKVTLSAVIHIDGILNLPDFQSSERALQLVTQTAGRAGRGETPGEVMVQTFYPDNPVLRIAETYDYMAFYRNEIALRRALEYPPVKKCARVLVSGQNEDTVREMINELSARCRAALPEKVSDSITWLGPSPAPVNRIQNRWRWHLILFADTWAPLAQCLRLIRDNSAIRARGIRVVIDMEPKSFI